MIHRLVLFLSLSLDWNGAFYHGGGLKGPARIVGYSMCTVYVCVCVCVIFVSVRGSDLCVFGWIRAISI